MKFSETKIPGVIILEPKLHLDERGYFFESWNRELFKKVTGINPTFVQDNHSYSTTDVLRGLHYQLSNPQGKLVRVISGKVLDVVVDLRKKSPSFGEYVSVELDGLNHRQIWVPPGCAHGFIVKSQNAELLYKVSGKYVPDDEHTIRWNDPNLSIDWQLGDSVPLVSRKDAAGTPLAEAPVFDE